MKYLLQVLGCQMNYVDAERVAAVLSVCGFTPTHDLGSADLYLFVTCSVRQKAEDRVYGLLDNLKTWKAQKPGRQIGITGCMVRHTSTQAGKKRDALLVRFPTLDFVWRIEDTGELAALAKIQISKSKIQNESVLATSGEVFGRHNNSPTLPIKSSPKLETMPPAFTKTYFSIQPILQNKAQVFVPIMTGCDNWCTYCVVPLARGREYSRPESEILAECERAVKNGAQEITLLGQNVNSYQKTRGAFAQLLSRVAEIPGLQRLRFFSSHPKDFDETVIDVMARHANIERHLHLPAQHGDDEILRRMNRKYTAETYLALIQKFRQRLPNASVTTDLIVGFPGETETAFQNLLAFYHVAEFDFAYFSKYSPRPGTVAADFPEIIPEKIKTERWKILNALVVVTTAKRYTRTHDQTLDVLVERCEHGICEGRSSEYFLVKFPGTRAFVGQIIPVKITEPREVELVGEKVE